jgi:glycosyltransferase involved in cell wall biosynthesis
MKNKSNVIVVLPAYNAQGTLKQTVNEIPKGVAQEIILVDDCSKDNTAQIAADLGLTVIQHNRNKGYGANQKTCYNVALGHKADIIVMLHPDYQYDPKIIKHLVDFLESDYFDVMLGSRIRSRKETLEGGMPFYKYISNRFLTIFENLVSGQNLSEWHTGMRAYKSSVLKSINYMNNSDDFVFDSQMLFQIVQKGFRIGEVPVPVRYSPEFSSINFTSSVKYGIGTLITALKYLFHFKI